MRKKIYISPDDSVIYEYASAVCEGLATALDDESYADDEMVYGFSEFLKAVMILEVNYRNGQFDLTHS